MTRSTVRRLLWTLLAAASGFAGTAQAALVTGRFDPEFGGVLGTTVSFYGTANFNINDACLTLGGSGFMTAGYQCSGQSAAMSFLNASVTFYTTGNTSATLGTVTFGPQTDAILGMFLQGGQVVGVQSTLIGPGSNSSALLTNLSLPSSSLFNLTFGMLNPPSKDSGESGFGADGDSDLDDITDPTAFQATWLTLVNSGNCGGSNQQSCTSNAATATYVPEPGSLALVFGALAVAGAVRRRRAR